jgi:hypothetical protein
VADEGADAGVGQREQHVEFGPVEGQTLNDDSQTTLRIFRDRAEAVALVSEWAGTAKRNEWSPAGWLFLCAGLGN